MAKKNEDVIVDLVVGGVSFAVGIFLAWWSEKQNNKTKAESDLDLAIKLIDKDQHQDALNILKTLDEKNPAVAFNKLLCVYHIDQADKQIPELVKICSTDEKYANDAKIALIGYLHETGDNLRALYECKCISKSKLDIQNRAYLYFLLGKIYLALEDEEGRDGVVSQLRKIHIKRAEEYIEELI
jgi:hypothetical protein